MFTHVISIAVAIVSQSPIGDPPTAQEFIEAAYVRRVQAINDAHARLSSALDKTDTSKLSKEAIAKIEKPLKDTITRLKARRDIDWNYDYPLTAELGEVFKLPRTHRTLAINDQFKVYYAIDKQSAAVIMDEPSYRRNLSEYYSRLINTVQDYKEKRRLNEECHEKLKAPIEDTIVIINGMKQGEFKDTKNSPINLSGLWRRIDDTMIDGKMRVTIERYPHEDAIRSGWPKFLESKLREIERAKT